MSIRIRPMNIETDLGRVTELVKLVMSQSITEADLREWEANCPEGALRHSVVATDETGWIAGFGEAERDPWRTPGEFGCNVIVDTSARNQGIGSRIYDQLLEFAQRHGATVLKVRARDSDTASLAFGQRRGFEIDRHVFESVLEIASFDADRFAGQIEVVEATGIRFFSFADVPGTEEDQRALYHLDTLTARDEPGSDPDEIWPFEQHRRDVFEASWFRPDGQLLAADGERWVGMTTVGEVHPGAMHNMATGVLREYRGRGIATALKLLGVAFCRKHGAATLRTGNDSLNTPMLAINRKLGYKPESGRYVLKRSVT